jgi:AraC-like DNA-binding protein
MNLRTSGNQFTYPLSRFQVLHTTDFERARHEIAKLFRDHRAVLLGSEGVLNVRVHSSPLRRTQLSYVSYGQETLLVIPPNESFFALQFPLSGTHRFKYGNETVDLSSSQASVASATRPLQLHFGENFSQLILKVGRASLEAHLEALTGVGVRRPIEFATRMEMNHGSGATLFRLIRFMANELNGSDSLIQAPLALTNLEDTVLTVMLIGLPHNYWARFQDDSPEAAPRQVRLVEKYIEAHAQDPLTVGDLAEVAGASARSLYRAFRRHRGYSPMAFLKSVRLDRARKMLMNAGDDATVTQVALDLGYHHFGRFSVEYRRRFGERPSQTLRKRL